MQLGNTAATYGAVHIALHWLTALSVVALFVSGLWMVGLGYYDPWYHRAPGLHKAAGMVLLAVIALRLVWRFAFGVPDDEPGIRRWELRAAHVAHALLYVLLLAVIVSGYVMVTAKGQAVDVFGMVSIPAAVSGLPRQEDLAGAVHYWVALALIGLAAIHALAALKHHFVDRDATLKKMLGRKRVAPDAHGRPAIPKPAEEKQT